MAAAVAAAGRRVDRVEGELGRRLERGFEELEEIHSAAAAAWEAAAAAKAEAVAATAREEEEEAAAATAEAARPNEPPVPPGLVDAGRFERRVSEAEDAAADAVDTAAHALRRVEYKQPSARVMSFCCTGLSLQ